MSNDYRFKLGDVRDLVAEPDHDFQDRGESARRAAGIDGTAGDAQDIPHPYRPDGDRPSCLLCGLAPSYRKHTYPALSREEQ